MEILSLPYQHIPQLASKDLAYATQNPALRPFFNHEPTLEGFGAYLLERSNFSVDRPLLVATLEVQYAGLVLPPKLQENLQNLAAAHTYTVTTAHQPSLFTGPLYYIYKIFSTINLAEKLSQRFPDYRFVPVFVNGAEDHDFEEINHAQVFGKNLVWSPPPMGGPVGLLPTASLDAVLTELTGLMGDGPWAQTLLEKIKLAYTAVPTYGEAAFRLVHSLFAEYGLVVLNMHAPGLKRRFAPLMARELFEQTSQPLIEATQEALQSLGFSSQAHARDINLFYLTPGRRDRIVRTAAGFEVLGVELFFSPETMATELELYPERFSPNVVMRPLFQEFILPNLAYVGGGGEIAYWLERKSQFAEFGIPYPILVRRNSVLWIDRPTRARLEKLGIAPADCFADTEVLIKDYLVTHSGAELSLTDEKNHLEALFERIRQKSLSIDPTLEKAVIGEGVKQLKVLEQLEGRLVRAEKQKHETALNQLRGVKEKLFPQQGLQERSENFISIYLKTGPAFFATLKEQLDPLAGEFLILLED